MIALLTTLPNLKSYIPFLEQKWNLPMRQPDLLCISFSQGPAKTVAVSLTLFLFGCLHVSFFFNPSLFL